jgi:L-fuconolactonase
MNANADDGWSNFIDEKRLAQVQEPIIAPDLPIVDPHHHLITWPVQYEADAWLKDLRSGHKVIATVHTEAHGNYWKDGPEHLRAAGETEYLAKAAEQAAKDPTAPKICAGIVGGGDMAMGRAKVDELLDAHIAAGKGRFRGVRINVFWGFNRDGSMFPLDGWQSVPDRTDLAEGLSSLARKGLCVELVNHHPNLPFVAKLAQKHPDLTIVSNHLATIMDHSPNPPSETDMMAAWRKGIDAIAGQPNIRLKLGGCANPMISFSMPALRALGARPKPPTSQELADVYRPQVSYAIEKLGPDRCMFESNFPIDKNFTSYAVLWNAFKRLAQPYSATEQTALFSGTATATYKLQL